MYVYGSEFARVFRPEGTPLDPAQREIRRLVLKQVTAQPESFSMADWESTRNRRGTCTTTRCIAGWAQFLTWGYVDKSTVEEDAVRALGLTAAEFEESGSEGLFWMDDCEAVARLRELADA